MIDFGGAPFGRVFWLQVTVRVNECLLLARAFAWVYLGCGFAIPILIFSLKTLQGARTFVYALPFLAGILATIICAAWRVESPRSKVIRGLTVSLVTIAGISSLANDVKVAQIRSGYSDIVQFLQRENKVGVAAWASVLECYLKHAGLTGGNVMARELLNPDYFISDWQELWKDSTVNGTVGEYYSRQNNKYSRDDYNNRYDKGFKKIGAKLVSMVTAPERFIPKPGIG